MIFNRQKTEHDAYFQSKKRQVLVGGAVILLAINAKYVHSSLSVWVLAAGIKKYSKAQHNVKVVEATINQQIEEIADSVAVYAPDIVGISTYIWNINMMPRLIDSLRNRLPNVLIVLGGPEASYNAAHWVENGADYVFQGECEYSFAVFLDALCNGATTHMPLLARCDILSPNGRPLRIHAPLKEHMCSRSNQAQTKQSVLDPYTEEYFTALGNRLVYIETSRGCPFSCAFCLSAGSAVTYFPLDSVKEQLYKLSQLDKHTIKFVDRTFNCNTDRAYALFEYIISLDTSCCFHFEAAADLFDMRTLELLAAAPPGRIQIEIGLQSFFAPALDASNRITDLEKAEKNIKKLLKANNCHIHVDLIAGLPYEELKDFKNSFNRAYCLGAHTIQLGFLKLLHGSKLREQAGSLGINYTQEAPYEITSSTWLSSSDMQILKDAENALQHTYNKSRFLTTIKYALASSELAPFEFYSALGSAYPHHALQLERYACFIFDFCRALPNADNNTLCDRMLYDWLGMVKGKNLPQFLKIKDNSTTGINRRKHIYNEAAKTLGREPERNEYAVLRSGGIFVDSQNRNPVTGLYKVLNRANEGRDHVYTVMTE